MEDKSLLGLVATAILFALIIDDVVGGDAWAAHYNEHDATCAVTSKDRGMNQDGNSNYRVHTKQCDTLEDVDSRWFGKYDSSNAYGEIQVGQTYIFHVAGLPQRIPQQLRQHHYGDA